MEAFWSFVAWIYLSPVRAWQDGILYESVRFFVSATLLGLLIWGLTAIIVYFSVRGIIRKYIWYTTRQRCQHCDAWTTRISAGTYDNCSADQPCCIDHLYRHRADAEPRYKCPADGTEMEKVINHLYQIIDVCSLPSCGSIFLSKAEHQEQLDDAEDDGHSSGMITGLAIGIST